MKKKALLEPGYFLVHEALAGFSDQKVYSGMNFQAIYAFDRQALHN